MPPPSVAVYRVSLDRTQAVGGRVDARREKARMRTEAALRIRVEKRNQFCYRLHLHDVRKD